MIRTAGTAVTRPEAMAPLLEALLLAYFCDDDEEVGNLKDRVSTYCVPVHRNRGCKEIIPLID